MHAIVRRSRVLRLVRFSPLAVLRWIAATQQAFRRREALRTLSDATLRDIGMTRAELLYEVAKPLRHFRDRSSRRR